MLAGALSLGACVPTTDQAGGPASTRDGWRASAPYRVDGEIALLADACLAYVESKVLTDLQPRGYKKNPRNFYYKGLHKDDAPASVAAGFITSSTLNYDRRSCRFSVGALGGRGSEQPFLRRANAIVYSHLQSKGYRKSGYPLRSGVMVDIWLREGRGVRLSILGTPGSEVAAVTVNPASEAEIAKAAARSGGRP